MSRGRGNGVWGSLAQGLAMGYSMGKDIKKTREEDALKESLAAAAADPVVAESNAGAEQAMEYGRAAQSIDPANFDSPEQYQAAQDAYIGAAQEALKSGQGAGFDVKGKQFSDRGEADTYANRLKLTGMAAAYDKAGRPEDALRLQDMAQQGELRGVQLKAAKIDLEQKKRMEDAYKTYQKDLAEAKGNFWEVAKRRFNDNAGHLGEGDNKDVSVEYAETPKGAIVWAKDKDGKQIGDARHVTREEVENDIIHSYYAKADPLKYADRKDRQKERAEDREYKVRRDAVEDKLRERQMGMTGAQLGMARERFNLEKPTLELAAANQKVMSDLRTQLSKTSDPAERENIQQRINDLAGSGGAGTMKVVKNEDGIGETLVFTDKRGNSYRIDPKALPMHQSTTKPGAADDDPLRMRGGKK